MCVYQCTGAGVVQKWLWVYVWTQNIVTCTVIIISTLLVWHCSHCPSHAAVVPVEEVCRDHSSAELVGVRKW